MTRQAEAFDRRKLGRVLPALWPMLWLMYVPGVPAIGSRIYQAIARNRYRLVKCDDGVCSLHLRALSRETISEDEIARVVQAARTSAMSRSSTPENAAT